MSSNPADRRRYPRKNFHRAIGVLNQGEYSICKTAEIGEGGLKVIGQDVLNVGDRILLNFFVNPDTFVAIKAFVRSDYVRMDRTNAYGVEFIDLPLSVKRIIRNFVADVN